MQMMPMSSNINEGQIGLASIPDICIPKNPNPRSGVAGCFLRSSQPTTPFQLTGRLTKQLEAELTGLGYSKKVRMFNVPTDAVCGGYDKLRTDIVTFLNLQKFVAKKENERNALRASRSQSNSKKK